MNKQAINDWGWAPVAVGFLLILIVTALLMLELQANNSNYLNYNVFYSFWFPIISFCLIAGAFFVVIGVVYLRKIRNKWSYASITAGFSLISIEAYRLAATIEGTYTRIAASYGYVGIGWYNFQQYWALDFFSVLMTACFLIVLGIILGLKVRNKLGYITITGGLAIMLVGVSILATNLTTSLDYYPPNYYFSLQVAWNTTISYFLIIGALIIVVGTGYLIWARNRNRSAREREFASPSIPTLNSTIAPSGL